ncbi:hypothetical protein SMSP2_02952 [Limihaloglobus sulfuriphilus]|uniref:Lipoprotein n=1 Tax=Limihaloglobus sulfuriphilus TaxID=1851148 RepID=A0A1Q2MJD9_9BACT|nr:hypothetical protein [Limihaloglobus sulfuriphilus]AQQ72562.1 hypothetical protein SMSP2_02952 [Limihaloglobus sulfuriphilus]
MNLNVIRKVLFVSLPAFLIVGCDSLPKGSPSLPAEHTYSKEDFLPVSIKFNGMTEISAGETENTISITPHIDVYDAAGSRIKAPGIVRFELFELIGRSQDSLGPRLKVWQDFNLNTFETNNRYWSDPLRCYIFSLELDSNLVKPDTQYQFTAVFISGTNRFSDQKRIDFNK